MLQQQHVLSVSVADSMMYRAELNPACHSSTLAWLLLPGPDISHGSDIVGDCKLRCHHLYTLHPCAASVYKRCTVSICLQT